MKDLFFLTNDWDIDTDAHSTVAVIKKIHSAPGRKVMGWQLGDWQFNWSSIYTEMKLSPGEEYCFHFWLNGGENDRHDEICELEIFGDDWNNRQSFALNRNHTKPVLYIKGWYLFSIPFTAPDEFVKFRFNIQRAIATILPATQTDLDLTKHIRSDREDLTRKQRHNIVFPGGYPESPKDELFRINRGDHSVPVRRSHVIAGITVLGIAFVALNGYISLKTRKRK
ncbi:MAG: hypothetical protein J5825_01120 [Lachnospiraceae bacterium]|nr:hypothetical protein [Lachnospiraceae bacterium]